MSGRSVCSQQPIEVELVAQLAKTKEIGLLKLNFSLDFFSLLQAILNQEYNWTISPNIVPLIGVTEEAAQERLGLCWSKFPRGLY